MARVNWVRAHRLGDVPGLAVELEDTVPAAVDGQRDSVVTGVALQCRVKLDRHSWAPKNSRGASKVAHLNRAVCSPSIVLAAFRADA